jgi:predicted SnoaL-like aldol condensation-catalyzing enzyme
MANTIDLKAHCLHFLDLISNKRDIATAEKMIHASCQFIHDDQPPKSRDEFLAFWPQMMSNAPKFNVEVRDVVREGNKVWVFSKVTGRMDGTDCDDLHMFEFKDDGMCLKSHGVHRVIQTY